MGEQLDPIVARRRSFRALTIAASSPAMDLRRQLKSTLEHGALWSGIPRAMRWRNRGDVLVLAYHNIVPDGEVPGGDRSLHLPRRQFATQLDALARTHDIISLERALRGHHGRRPAIVITFDDAYQGAVTAGVAELARRGLPATIFVATAFVDGGEFWWDALARPELGAPLPAFRARALHDCAGEDAAVRAMAALEGLEIAAPTPAHARGAAESALIAAAAVPGITLGSHSHSHPNLARLSAAALREELTRPLAWLRDRFQGVLPTLSYPYGLSSPDVERAAAAAGYTSAFRIDGGWLRQGAATPFAQPRMDVPSGVSTAGFALRCAGVRLP
jgi:peptidoglycan/xylan/chitin deacetylase (PgdA/CDA1 family)